MYSSTRIFYPMSTLSCIRIHFINNMTIQWPVKYLFTLFINYFRSFLEPQSYHSTVDWGFPLIIGSRHCSGGVLSISVCILPLVRWCLCGLFCYCLVFKFQLSLPEKTPVIYVCIPSRTLHKCHNVRDVPIIQPWCIVCILPNYLGHHLLDCWNHLCLGWFA